LYFKDGFEHSVIILIEYSGIVDMLRGVTSPSVALFHVDRIAFSNCRNDSNETANISGFLFKEIIRNWITRFCPLKLQNYLAWLELSFKCFAMDLKQFSSGRAKTILTVIQLSWDYLIWTHSRLSKVLVEDYKWGMNSMNDTPKINENEYWL